jgi:3-hydroxybutyryl-CoA dehydrogenase
VLDAASGRIKDELAMLPHLPQYAHHAFRIEPPADHQALLERIGIADALGTAVEGAELVIEAVREDLATKQSLFAELDRLAPQAILSTNSSSIPSSLIAPVVGNPGRLLNTHFFAPVWSRPMVELMGCGQTTPETMTRVEAFARSLGIVAATVRGDSKGFIINRVWRAVKREALRVVDEGHAEPEDVDRLWMIFFGTPSGPFGIMDMVGLDVVADIEASYAAVATDPEDRASPVLHRLVDAGQLGEKSSQGFYRHPDPPYLDPAWLRAGEGRDAGTGDPSTTSGPGT